MKLVINEDEKIVLYLYDYFFNLEKENITREIKELFLKLIKYYSLKLNGIYEVLLFENSKYGTILEINKIKELLFNKDVIDIKVKIYKKANIYLKTKDYFILEKYKNIYSKDNNYYININDVDKIINLIEFIDIIYKEKDNYLNKMLFIK